MKLATFEKSEMPQAAARLLHQGLVFGFTFEAATQKFIGAICAPAHVVPVRNFMDLETKKLRHGYVALPFDIENKTGFFIPHVPEAGFNSVESKVTWSTTQPPDPKATTRTAYEACVNKAVQAIKAGHFSKLVVSRALQISFEEPQLATALRLAFDGNTESHFSIFHIPEKGLWISASPEILLQKNGNQLMTMALAGTQPNHNGKPHWQPKEVEEQALVASYIRDQLATTIPFRFEETAPKTVEAGNLLHIRSDFDIFDANQNEFYTLADALHPTPAVCGNPAREALRWLRENEGFDRDFYAGCGGYITPDESKIVVLLRSAKLEKNRLTLYAGAGITADSEAEKEWQETEEKMKTLGRFMSR